MSGVPVAVEVQDPGDVAGDLPDARRGPLPLRHDVPQQDPRRRRHAVVSRPTVTPRPTGLSLRGSYTQSESPGGSTNQYHCHWGELPAFSVGLCYNGRIHSGKRVRCQSYRPIGHIQGGPKKPHCFSDLITL